MTALRERVRLTDGGVAAYEVIGSGEPLFYFQGGPGFSANLLRDDAELLADRFAVYLIDPHGCGGSTPPADPARYDHTGHARFYDSVRQALGIERAVIMGISFGSLVALTYAALFPAATKSCIAVAARAVGEEEEGEDATEEMEQMLARHAHAPWYPSARRTWDEWTPRVLAATRGADVDAMMAEVLPLYCADPERPGVKRLIERWRRESRGGLDAMKAWESGLWQKIDIRPLLDQISAPTLLIVGALDPICGPAHTAPITDAVSNIRLVSVPDCGHFVPAEAPDAFRRAVLEFAG